MAQKQKNPVRNHPIETSPQIAPAILEAIEQLGEPEWKVTVFNNSVNTYDEVVVILILATGCDFDEAYSETWDIDHYGQCVVHRGVESECLSAAKVIAKIGIKVEVCREES